VRPAARGYALVVLAAGFWATLGLFYKTIIDQYGLPPLTVVFFRAAVSGLVLFALLLAGQRRRLVVARRDWPFFLFFALVGIAGFYAVYVYAIHLTGMAMAAVLMYTAPAWVALMAWRLFGEPLNRIKVAALALCFAGSVLVARLLEPGQLQMNGLGILCGLGAGIAYGIYSICNRVAMDRHYSVWTALAWPNLLGAVFLLLLQPSGMVGKALTTPAALAWLLVLGIVPTLGGAGSYFLGLRHLPVSVASVVATLEPVFAAVMGYLVWHETLTPLQLAGCGLILGGVVLLRLWG
jgi:DME family drug/metabolite transporter